MADAIDWLDKNADKSVDDLKADDANAAEDGAPADPVLQVGETARSLVCNDCGKKFRSTAQAEFHASKTEHQDFSESTEEIAPLTEEEKKQKLADLKEKLAEKRAMQSEQDKIDKKRNEEINRKKTKESQDIKEQLKMKESMKEAELKRKEKAADIEAKRRIQAKIAADKEERRLKNEREKAQRAGQALPSCRSHSTRTNACGDFKTRISVHRNKTTTADSERQCDEDIPCGYDTVRSRCGIE